MHYKELRGPKLDDDQLEAFEFKGQDATMTIKEIVRVKTDEIDQRTGKPKHVAKMYFDSKNPKRYYLVPRLVQYGLAIELGHETDEWVGQKITLYPTKCAAFGEIVDCIRVRFQPATLEAIRKYAKKLKINMRMFECKESE